jgi:hypothetical protein
MVLTEGEMMSKQKTDSDQIRPISVGDLPKWGDAAEASERSYRRGFVHGFSMAIDAAEKCMTISDMLDYLNNDLAEWRESSADSEKMPPNLP